MNSEKTVIMKYSELLAVTKFCKLACLGISVYYCSASAEGVNGTEPCSRFYQGPSPASELETKAIQAEAVRLGPTLLTSIHMHTYGQLWLIPWGASHPNQSCIIAADHDEMVTSACRVLLTSESSRAVKIGPSPFPGGRS